MIFFDNPIYASTCVYVSIVYVYTVGSQFQQSSGIFEYLRSNILLAVHAETTPDLQPDALAALAALMLAQAQELVVHKCIRGRRTCTIYIINLIYIQTRARDFIRIQC